MKLLELNHVEKSSKIPFIPSVKEGEIIHRHPGNPPRCAVTMPEDHGHERW